MKDKRNLMTTLKYRMLKTIRKVLFFVAVFAAATPSQVGSFQAKCPESLEKYHF